ncbi:MAG TPA: NAD(P)H-binding protein [Verrucomicrobiae bacterium]|jgi:NAD(P)H dehydrogenase (quinone)|nr:NAD(P)H-binding protein [Verrucomicrobiae bacterium]
MRTADDGPILVTGAAGQLGAVGRTVTELLLERGLPVRAMVRREDDRAEALRAAGAEVVVGDLLEPSDVYRVVHGCRRAYFGMSVSAGYLEASVLMAAVARKVGVDALVNMSQMTVSQMSIQNTTKSRQQRQHWLSEQALAWSGLPVVTIRPTIFLESFLPLVAPTVREKGRILLPFGRGKTSPVSAEDVARVVAAVLAEPAPHLGGIYELTGPLSQDMHGVAREFSDALNREVTYSDVPPELWEEELKKQGVPEHLIGHLVTMGELHRADRYDRLADGVRRVTGRPAMSVREFVSRHADEFGGRRQNSHSNAELNQL